MRIGFAGSPDIVVNDDILKLFQAHVPEDAIVCAGNCRGVEQLSKKFAKNIQYLPWYGYNSSTGYGWKHTVAGNITTFDKFIERKFKFATKNKTTLAVVRRYCAMVLGIKEGNRLDLLLIYKTADEYNFAEAIAKAYNIPVKNLWKPRPRCKSSDLLEVIKYTAEGNELAIYPQSNKETRPVELLRPNMLQSWYGGLKKTKVRALNVLDYRWNTPFIGKTYKYFDNFVEDLEICQGNYNRHLGKVYLFNRTKNTLQRVSRLGKLDSEVICYHPAKIFTKGVIQCIQDYGHTVKIFVKGGRLTRKILLFTNEHTQFVRWFLVPKGMKEIVEDKCIEHFAYTKILRDSKEITVTTLDEARPRSEFTDVFAEDAELHEAFENAVEEGLLDEYPIPFVDETMSTKTTKNWGIIPEYDPEEDPGDDYYSSLLQDFANTERQLLKPYPYIVHEQALCMKLQGKTGTIYGNLIITSIDGVLTVTERSE